jgi:hypothetical protein
LVEILEETRKRSKLSFTSGIIHQDAQEQEYQKRERERERERGKGTERTNSTKRKEGSSLLQGDQSYPFFSFNLLPEMAKIRKITLNIR